MLHPLQGGSLNGQVSPLNNIEILIIDKYIIKVRKAFIHPILKSIDTLTFIEVSHMAGRLSPFLILIAAILWGTTGTAQALAPENAHPIAIGATRLAVGGLFLLCIVIITGRLHLKHWPFKLVILASLSMAMYQPLFFSAVTITGVAVGTVVAIGSAPILSGCIEWIFFKKRPPMIWWYSTILSITGCVLL